MKWKLLGYAFWLFAVISLIGIPVTIYMAITGKLDPKLGTFSSTFALSLFRVFWAIVLFYLGRFFIRKS